MDPALDRPSRWCLAGSPISGYDIRRRPTAADALATALAGTSNGLQTQPTPRQSAGTASTPTKAGSGAAGASPRTGGQKIPEIFGRWKTTS
jgi:hypothetical protein